MRRCQTNFRANYRCFVCVGYYFRYICNMYRDIKHIIPPEYRRRGMVAAVAILLRAILNFFSIAMLVPLLTIILDSDNIATYPIVGDLYAIMGNPSTSRFALVVAVGVVVLIIIKSAVSLFLYRYERDYVYNLYGYLSRKLYINYYTRGYAFVKSSNSAELSRNVNLVCLNFVAGVLRPLAVMAGEVLLFVLIGVALACVDVVVVLVVLAVLLPASILYYRVIRRRLQSYGEAENEALRAKFRDVAESFRGYADVEINNAFPRLLSSFEAQTERLIDMRKRDAMLSVIPQNLIEIAITSAMAALVVVGVLWPEGNVGVLFGMFAVAAMRLMPSVRSILSSLSSIRYNSYTIDILKDIDGEEDLVCDERRLEFKHSLELNDVTFDYGEGRERVFDSISLELKRGERLGIRGASGAGKSTLMNIMLGLYSPTSGELRVDGQILDDLARRMWQNSVGYVPQSVFMADSTLAENVALGVARDKIDRERVVRVLKMASLDAFVESLPQGIDSRIGEAGCRVSGGERQRIGIARALYRRPDVLFFDEATSSLDSETEHSVNESIAQLAANDKELTIVVIAHRESSLGYCDRIITIGEK